MHKPKKYSLIVIGAGITGLSTALAWTKVYNSVEKPVLVIEKNRIPGGCVSTFARKGYRFDTTQIIPHVSDLLTFFDVDVPLCKFDNYYARLFLADTKNKTSKIIPIHSRADEFERQMIERYPEDEKNIKRFFSYCIQMHNELVFLKTEPRWYQIPGILIQCRKIIANSNKTYHQFLEKFKFNNHELYQVLDIFSSFSGLSGNRCAALLTACAMITTLKGSYRPEKGFIHFTLMLAKKLTEKGAEIRYNATVQKILVEKNKVYGVQLSSGEIIESDYLVSTADIKLTFDKLLNKTDLHLPRNSYFKKLEKIKMSPSGISIHIGLDETIDLEKMGFNCGYNVLTSSLNSHSEMFDAWEKNELIMQDDNFHLGVICPSLMTKEKPCIIIHVVPAPTKIWEQLRIIDKEKYMTEKMRVADFYIQKVEEYMIPDLRKHICIVDVSTPATFIRFIGSPTGSQFDMMPVPSNFGKNRLKTRTPINGLFIPKFSHGIWPCMQAGLQTVDMITNGKIMHGNASYSQYKFEKSNIML